YRRRVCRAGHRGHARVGRGPAFAEGAGRAARAVQDPGNGHAGAAGRESPHRLSLECGLEVAATPRVQSVASRSSRTLVVGRPVSVSKSVETKPSDAIPKPPAPVPPSTISIVSPLTEAAASAISRAPTTADPVTS